MDLSLQVVTFLLVVISVIHIVAISLTFLRLYHRHSISRLWWDDCTAAVACILDCVAILDLWLGKVKSLNEIVEYKIGFLSLISAEWATRIALALAFARVSERTRNYAMSLAILFLSLFVVVLVQTLLSCNNNFAWISASFSKCDFNDELLIFMVAANLFADVLLVCSPLYALRRLRLPKDQRRLIFACFAGSALMSLACITTTVFQFLSLSWKEMRIISGYLEGGVSLIVCNLLVVVTYFYKVLRQQRDVEEEEVPAPDGPQDMSEIDRATLPTPTRGVGTEQHVTSVNFTEISGAYFTDPILTSRPDGPQDMSETDRTTLPTPTRSVGTEEHVASVNFTEISGAYFTDPISTSREEP